MSPSSHALRDQLLAPPVPMTRGTGDKPVAAAKLLGAHLRNLRLERGLAIKDVAPVIRASISKISRMERGENMPSERDVWDLVKLYGVDDAHRRWEIGDLLRQVKAPVWWQQYSDLTPGWLRRLIGLEDSAQEIRTYEMIVVPGLLQTPAYTRAVVKAGLPNASPQEIERRVQLRMERQRVLSGPGAPKLRVLLDESVLQRPRGGAEVMVEQLKYLKRMALRPGITIRIVRFVRAANITPPTPITYMKFAVGGLPEMVYLEHAGNAVYLNDPNDLLAHRLILDELAGAAESRTSTIALLDKAIADFSSTI